MNGADWVSDRHPPDSGDYLITRIPTLHVEIGSWCAETRRWRIGREQLMIAEVGAWTRMPGPAPACRDLMQSVVTGSPLATGPWLFDSERAEAAEEKT